MNQFYRLVLLVGFFALNSILSAQEMRDSKGKDFWIAFPQNHSGNATPSLFISSETATSGTVAIPGLGYSSNFTTTPGVMTTVVLNSSHELKVPNGIENKGIHITAQEEITVYGLSRYSATTDAFLCLPTDIIGDSYIIPSYIGLGGSDAASQLVVVGTQNTTTVTIIPTVTAQTRAAGVPFTISLNQGEAFQLQATSTGDLTGSSIISSAPVAVFGAVQCANIPVGCTACDFIAEEIPPISTWGENFISAPLKGRSGDTYRFLASEDNTTITVNGTALATLNKGSFFEALFSIGLHITSDNPILVIQYSRGQSCAGAPGDPFMMLIPPYEQFLGKYTISTSDNGFSKNYINLVVPTRAIGDVRVDGSIVPAGSFSSIGTSGFHHASISITIGTHTINSNYPVGVHVYGFGTYDSYGYPGGQSFSQIAYIDSITLTPPSSTAQTGTSSCVEATVFDNNGNKVPSLRVDFYILGANPSSGFAFTDSNGVAQYCYTGRSAGRDSIHAVTGSLTSNIVYKTWISTTSPVADAGPDRNLYAGSADCFTDVILDGSRSFDPEGDPLNYSWTGPFPGTLSGVTVTERLHVGRNEIVLVVDDRGVSDADTVIITILDTIPPVPTRSSLPDITSECTFTVSEYPTANDNCSGTVTGTAAPITFNTQGRHSIFWTFTDSSGNAFTQTQTVIIIDTTPPQPENSILPILYGECTAQLIPPFALDNCAGRVTASTSSPMTIRTRGRHTVTWTYKDSNGNAFSQPQTVIINDSTPPQPEISDLPVLFGECSKDLIPPFAIDNCIGRVVASTTSPLTIRTRGTHTVTWTYKDSSGNVFTQLQTVIINDTTPPVPEIANLPVLYGECSVQLIPPFATDNCIGKITASTSSPLFIRSQGTHIVTWRYDDGNGNIFNQNQTVIIIDTIAPVTGSVRDTTIIVKNITPGISVKLDTIRATDNCDQSVVIGASRSDGLSLGERYNIGSTVVKWKVCDNSSNCDSTSQSITIIKNQLPIIDVPADTTISESNTLEFRIKASDPDSTVPLVWIDNIAIPYELKYDSIGAYILSFITGCNDHGVYKVKVYGTDYIDTIVDSFTITIEDKNFRPEFSTQYYHTAHELVPFNLLVSVFDCDTMKPQLRIVNAPPGSQFIDHNNGTATFSWLPDEDDNGFYVIIFEAKDDSIIVRDTIIIEVKDVNGFPPQLSISTLDTIVPVHLPLVINVRGSDRDNTPPHLSVAQLPEGAEFKTDDAGNGIIRWVPTQIGVFRFSVTAVDMVDSNVTVTAIVKITVSGENVTGPHFLPSQDTTIDQNTKMVLNFKAIDLDGSIPQLQCIQKPDGTSFSDHSDGSGLVTWVPGCDVTGVFAITAIATDGMFTDTITVRITVRDINCPPVIHPVSDINIAKGELVRIPVSAYDPDGTTQNLILSASCDLPGYTFTSSGNDNALFVWEAVFDTGTYPVKFTVTDGLLTDSIVIHININKKGTVKLSASPAQSSIFIMPSTHHSGEFLGTDAIDTSILPGTYHFEVRNDGYRSSRFHLQVIADETVTKACTLKSLIPLMTSKPDTLTFNRLNTSSAPFYFADINTDGLLDFTVFESESLMVYYQHSDGTYDRNPLCILNIPSQLQPVSYALVDWNNDKTLDCIYSDVNGSIVFVNLKNMISSTVIDLPGSRCFVSVLDANRDHKKDLVINCVKKGLFVYYNDGTDRSPSFSSKIESKSLDGQPITTLSGPLLFSDFDGNGQEEMITFSNGILSLFKTDSMLTKITYIEDLSCGGMRYISDSSYSALMNSADLPALVFLNSGKLQLFKTQLCGDVTNDGKVDIRDISKISKLWEITENDSLWNPECNLKLGPSGKESIDIRDIGRAAKSWELQE